MSAHANINVCRLAAGQVALHDLRARSAVVAVEGDLQLVVRDHSLSWLGDAVPSTSIMLSEGECFVPIERSMVSISALHGKAAAFALPASHAAARSNTQHANGIRQLAAFLKATLRRAA